MIWTFILFYFITQPPGVIRHGVDKKLSLELAQQDIYRCVGKMTQGSRVRGSCVLIHPGIALTAAHTLMKLTKDFPLELQFDSLRYAVDSFLIHPRYHNNKDADLAIIYLSQPLTPIDLPLLNKNKKETNQIGTSVGWGNFSVANDPNSIVDAGRFKSAGTNYLDSIVGQPLANGQLPYLYADFDQPDSDRFNRTGQSTATDLEFGLDGGDSGGGMFVFSKNKVWLTGINAIQNKNIADIIRTKSFYGSSSQWVRISVFQKWIKKEIKKYNHLRRKK